MFDVLSFIGDFSFSGDVRILEFMVSFSLFGRWGIWKVLVW